MLLHRNERGIPENPMRLLIEGVWRDGPTTPPMGASAKYAAASTTH
jgi:hypothetical protein